MILKTAENFQWAKEAEFHLALLLDVKAEQTKWNLWNWCGLRSVINMKIHVPSLSVCMYVHTNKTQDLPVNDSMGLWNVCKFFSSDFFA